MAVLSYLHGASSTILSNVFVTLPVPVATPELPHQTVIVTGANTGLGLEASRHLLRIGVGKLIMGVRDLQKGEKARAELLKTTGRLADSVEVWHVDMEDYNSVKVFADRATMLPRLDAVVANAGVLPKEFVLCNGIEKTIAINVVSTYLLFFLVLPKLRQAPSGAHFVVPNSAMHYMAPMENLVPSPDGRTIFSRLNDSAADPGPMERYSISKLLCVYVTRELASRMKAADSKNLNSRVIVNTPNPSFCKSGLMRETSAMAPPDFLSRTVEMGSRALVHGLLAGPESNGQYLTNCHVQT
jgi:NAD(P)-dependent dehydrogenase (short-subunit alcohol dehydrogenase family)